MTANNKNEKKYYNFFYLPVFILKYLQKIW